MQQIKRAFIMLLAIGFIFSFQSCKKDEASRTELLTDQGGWTLTNTDINGEEIADLFVDLIFQSIPESEQTPENEAEIRSGFDFEEAFLLEECDKDDITFFNEDGSMTEDLGAVKCSSGSPQTSTIGTWTFSNDERQLNVIDTDGDVQTFDIISITNTTLTIQLSMALGDEESDFEIGFEIEEFEELVGTAVYEEFLTTEFKAIFTFKAN
ncbi:MAG: lipocalin family protein [Chitinophagales bacterium]